MRGVAGMVEDDRYCVDVLTQIAAIRAALQKVEEEVLRDHVSHCVAGAFTDGNVGGAAAEDRGTGRHRGPDVAMRGARGIVWFVVTFIIVAAIAGVLMLFR